MKIKILSSLKLRGEKSKLTMYNLSNHLVKEFEYDDLYDIKKTVSYQNKDVIMNLEESEIKSFYNKEEYEEYNKSKIEELKIIKDLGSNIELISKYLKIKGKKSSNSYLKENFELVDTNLNKNDNNGTLIYYLDGSNGTPMKQSNPSNKFLNSYRYPKFFKFYFKKEEGNYKIDIDDVTLEKYEDFIRISKYLLNTIENDVKFQTVLKRKKENKTFIEKVLNPFGF